MIRRLLAIQDVFCFGFQQWANLTIGLKCFFNRGTLLKVSELKLEVHGSVL